ncbi:MAG: hypothetical protein Q8Q09_12760 [Deltaproteobacteria bacterium]|nr:hypothetical protein [Deltaproteobacteria bacterium]
MPRSEWIQVGALVGVDDATLQRIARYEGAEIVQQPSTDRKRTRVLSEQADTGFEIQYRAERVDGASMRALYRLGESLEQRLAALRSIADSRLPYYQRTAMHPALLAAASTEAEREAIAAVANECFAALSDEECPTSDGALVLAMQGYPAAASCGRSLWISDDSDPEALAWLVADPTRLPHLRRISIGEAYRPERLQFLSKLAGRHELTVKLHGLTRDSWEDACAALPEGLYGLDLHYAMGGAALCNALTKSPAWQSLRSLNLHNNELKSEGLKVLIESPKQLAFEALDLGYNHLKGPDFAALAGAPWLEGVSQLAIHFNDAKAKGATVLVSSPRLSALESLNFGANEAGDAPIKALCKRKDLTTLKKLDLEGNHKKPLVSAKGAELLAQWPAAKSLEAIQLGKNTLGNDGVMALVKSPNLTALDLLDVQYCDVTTGLFDALSGVETATAPGHVILTGNTLGKGRFGDKPSQPQQPEPGHPWMGQRWLRNCHTLNLYACGLSGDDVAALCASDSLQSLRSLNLSSNYGLGNEALALVLNSSAFSQLELLEVLYWELSDGAAKILMESSLGPSLLWLSLSRKGLSESECEKIAKHFAGRLYFT